MNPDSPLRNPPPPAPAGGADGHAYPSLSVARPQRRRRPTWPVVIGTVSISLACLFLLWHTLFTLILAQYGGGISVVISSLHWLLDVVLLGAGILVVQRKPAGRKVHLAWAWISLALLLVRILAVAILVGDRRTDLDVPLWNFVLEWCLILGPTAVYPLFMLIWMTRRFVEKDLLRW